MDGFGLVRHLLVSVGMTKVCSIPAIASDILALSYLKLVVKR